MLCFNHLTGSQYGGYGGSAYGRPGYGSSSMYGGGGLSSGYGSMGNSYGGAWLHNRSKTYMAHSFVLGISSKVERIVSTTKLLLHDVVGSLDARDMAADNVIVVY